MRHLPSAIAFLAIALTSPALAAAPSAGCKLQELVTLPVTMVGTRPTVEIKINGKADRLLIDSGAFFSMLTPQAAKSFGLTTTIESRVRTSGVGGSAETRSTNVSEFTLAGLPFHRVDFLVVDGAGGGVAGLLGENSISEGWRECPTANRSWRCRTSTKRSS